MLRLEDLNYHSVFDHQLGEEEAEIEQVAEEEEVKDSMETQMSSRSIRSRTDHNYLQDDDVALCYAWINIFIDATVGTDQSKDCFWGENCRLLQQLRGCHIKPPQGSLGHRWVPLGTIQDQCN